MSKNIIIAGTALVAAFAVFQPVEKAQAGVNLDIGIVIPVHGSYGGYHRPHHYAPRRRAYGRISCRQARRIVRNRGFYRVRTIRCGGYNYVFHAKKRGLWWRMNIKATTGSMYAVRRLY